MVQKFSKVEYSWIQFDSKSADIDHWQWK